MRALPRGLLFNDDIKERKMHAEPDRPSLWVLVGEASVAATQAPFLCQNGPDCGPYVRTTLALHGLALADIPSPFCISLRADSDAFRAVIEARRARFYQELVDHLACLHEFGVRAPANNPRKSESVTEYAARMLACAEALWQNIERDGDNNASKEPDAGLCAFRDALGQLARHLSARLSADSQFYDAIAQSVCIPTWAELERRADTLDDDLWLVPVNLA